MMEIYSEYLQLFGHKSCTMNSKSYNNRIPITSGDEDNPKAYRNESEESDGPTSVYQRMSMGREAAKSEGNTYRDTQSKYKKRER